MSTALAATPMPAAATPTHDPAALTLSARDLAKELRCSVKTIARLDQSGKLPAAIRVGRAKRWLRSTIVAWLADGCPSQRELAAMRDRKGLVDFPQIWELFEIALPKRVREVRFAPEHADLVAHFQRAQKSGCRSARRRWGLNAAFAFRTVWLISVCFRPLNWWVLLAAAVWRASPGIIHWLK